MAHRQCVGKQLRTDPEGLVAKIFNSQSLLLDLSSSFGTMDKHRRLSQIAIKRFFVVKKLFESKRCIPLTQGELNIRFQ